MLRQIETDGPPAYRLRTRNLSLAIQKREDRRHCHPLSSGRYS